MIKLFLIGAGGFFGAVFRYLLSGAVHQIIPARAGFPYGTVVVNIFGCLLIGLFSGLTETRQLFTPEARLVIFIGLLGGFTTFSTFGYESFSMMRDGELAAFLVNVFFHLFFGLAAVWLGHVLSKII
ncbi:MAG: fluoride efflux transporter CrcB [bacterium]